MRFRFVEQIGSSFEDTEEWPKGCGLRLVVGLGLLVLVLVLVVVLVVELVVVLVVETLRVATAAVGDDVRDVAVRVVHGLV